MTDLKRSVSVVISTHNRETFLINAIISAMRQTLPPLEVIVVDDNSSDGTERAVAEFGDKRITYLRHVECLGAGAARNTGIEQARGDYIAFLDDDDQWLPGKLEHQVNLLAKYEAVLCASYQKTSALADRRFESHKVTWEELRAGWVFSGGASNLMMETALAKDCLFDESLPCGEDWDMLIRIAQRADLYYSNEPLVVYNDEPHERITNASQRMSLDRLEDRMAVIHKQQAFLGPYWANYNIARTLLSHVRSRQDKLSHLAMTVNRCGWRPTLGALREKFKRRLPRSRMKPVFFDQWPHEVEMRPSK